MKLPNLQREKYDAWLEALDAIPEAVTSQCFEKLKESITTLQTAAEARGEEAKVTDAEGRELVRQYSLVLIRSLSLMGGEEYFAVKQAAKQIAEDILTFLKQRGNESYFPAMQAVSQSDFLRSVYAWRTFAYAEIEFVRRPLQMAFDPTDSQLHFLVSTELKDETLGAANMQYNNENRNKLFYKIFNPVSVSDVEEEIAARVPLPEDGSLARSPSPDSDGGHSAAASSTASSTSRKRGAPGTVSDGGLHDGISVDSVFDLNIQNGQYLWQLKDGSLRYRAASTEGTTDDSEYTIEPEVSRNTRYFYHCHRNTVAKVMGDKCVVLYSNGKKREGPYAINSLLFPCAVMNIAFSPAGTAFTILFVNGQFIVYRITGGGIIPSEIKTVGGLPSDIEAAKKFNSPTSIYSKRIRKANTFVAEYVNWLNGEQFLLLNESGASMRFKLSPVVGEQPPKLIMLGAQVSTYENKHFHYLPLQRQKTSVIVELADGRTGQQEALQEPNYRLGKDAAGKDIVIPENYTGVVFYQKQHGGNSHCFYKIDGDHVKFSRALNYEDKNKYPVGIALSQTNRFLAIRYNDRTIDVIDHKILLQSKSQLKIQKATHSISATGQSLQGYVKCSIKPAVSSGSSAYAL